MTMKFNRVLKVVEVHVHAKFHQAQYSSLRVIMSTSFFAPSCNGEKSGPVTLKFSGFCAVIKERVSAKFRQAKYSG